MNTGRRIAAAALTAAITLGALGMTTAPATASADTSWPQVVSDH